MTKVRRAAHAVTIALSIGAGFAIGLHLQTREVLAAASQSNQPQPNQWPFQTNLTGTWHPNGNRSQACFIRQRGKQLYLRNEAHQVAQGHVESRLQVTTVWAGKTIGGKISHDFTRIDWDNGTYWIRQPPAYR